jgi:hypothetical protein
MNEGWKTRKIIFAGSRFSMSRWASEMRKRLNSQPSDGVLLRRFPDVKLHVDGEYTTARVQRMIKKLHRGDNASGAGAIGCGN